MPLVPQYNSRAEKISWKSWSTFVISARSKSAWGRAHSIKGCNTPPSIKSGLDPTWCAWAAAYDLRLNIFGNCASIRSSVMNSNEYFSFRHRTWSIICACANWELSYPVLLTNITVSYPLWPSFFNRREKKKNSARITFFPLLPCKKRVREGPTGILWTIRIGYGWHFLMVILGFSGHA